MFLLGSHIPTPIKRTVITRERGVKIIDTCGGEIADINLSRELLHLQTDSGLYSLPIEGRGNHTYREQCFQCPYRTLNVHVIKVLAH